jgi:uncharacterized membrane protein
MEWSGLTMKRFSKAVFRRLRNWFFTGLVLLLPFALSFYVLLIGFRWMDAILGGFAARTVGRRIPGLGLVASLLMVVVAGAIASNLIGRRLLNWGETVLLKVPVFRSVYSTMKQVVDAFAGQDKSAFKEVVMIEYPRKGMYSVGFYTGNGFDEASAKTGEDWVTVFVPTVPNPTTGFFVLVPREEVVRLDMSVEDAIKMTISAGCIVPDAAVLADIPSEGGSNVDQ